MADEAMQAYVQSLAPGTPPSTTPGIGTTATPVAPVQNTAENTNRWRAFFSNPAAMSQLATVGAWIAAGQGGGQALAAGAQQGAATSQARARAASEILESDEENRRIDQLTERTGILRGEQQERVRANQAREGLEGERVANERQRTELARQRLGLEGTRLNIDMTNTLIDAIQLREQVRQRDQQLNIDQQDADTRKQSADTQQKGMEGLNRYRDALVQQAQNEEDRGRISDSWDIALSIMGEPPLDPAAFPDWQRGVLSVARQTWLNWTDPEAMDEIRKAAEAAQAQAQESPGPAPETPAATPQVMSKPPPIEEFKTSVEQTRATREAEVAEKAASKEQKALAGRALNRALSIISQTSPKPAKLEQAYNQLREQWDSMDEDQQRTAQQFIETIRKLMVRAQPDGQ